MLPESGIEKTESSMIYFDAIETEKEAINRSIIRAKGLKRQDLVINVDVTDYMKTACDEVYIKMQTLVKDYEFTEKKRIAYRLNLPEDFDKELIKVIYTLCKDYIVEGILKGYYFDIGATDAAMLSTQKQDIMMQKLQRYRLQRTKRIKLKYHGL